MTKMKSFFGWHQMLSIGRRALLLTLPLWLAACGGGAPGDSTPGSLAPTVTLSANPGTVASGGSTTVTWSSTNATSCTASGSWLGAKNTSGTQSFSNLTGNQTYTLSCTGSGGTSSTTVTVTSSTSSVPTRTPTPTPKTTAAPTPTPGTTLPAAPTVTLAASPAFVSVNDSSKLTWSSTNASSCTASGAWDGSKPTSGNLSVGPLTAAVTYTLSCTGAGGTAKRSVTITVGTPSSGGALSIPSVADERNTYIKWGWTSNASKEPGAVTEPKANYYVTNVDIHYGSEGDDLWTYLMMYRRSGNPVYLNRAQAWARYFKDEYRASGKYQIDDKGFLLDHMYGWGLVAWYEHSCTTSTCDTAALAEAENLAADVEAYWSTRSNGTWPVAGQFEMSVYGPRGPARHLLLVTRVAEATGNTRWINLRDKLIDLWIKSPDWDPRGIYFVGEEETDGKRGSGAYASGIRLQSAFQIGVLTEAFIQAYRITGRPELKDRLVAMAKFIDQYALDANSQYVCSWFGLKNGAPYSGCAGGSIWDPVYATSLVNTLVNGYKYTGDRYYYDRAKYFFNRGTKGKYGTGERTALDNVVGHFVDTVFLTSSENFYLDFNKGELQYTYLIFENGGL